MNFSAGAPKIFSKEINVAGTVSRKPLYQNSIVRRNKPTETSLSSFLRVLKDSDTTLVRPPWGKAMFRATIFSLALLLVTATPPVSVAGEFGTKDEAVAMVKRVQEKLKNDGPESTFAAVTNKDREFHDRDLYPFIYRLNGINVAHGARPALVGKNLLMLKDPDGVPLIRMMVEIANGPGTGWIDYKWPNPITNAIEDKTSYIEKMGDYFVGVGVYRQ